MPIPDIELEDVPCPVCGTRDDDPVLTGHDRLHGLPGEFSIVRCRHCGLKRTNPRPTPQTIGQYYPGDYLPYQQAATPMGRQSSTFSTRKSGIKSAIRQITQLDAKRLPLEPPGRLLEIGCSSGTYLKAMQDLGWQVQGIEFSEAAADKARILGLEVQCSTLEEAEPPAEPVDIVAAWMVLEHLHDPVGSLRRIREWVKPGGYLVASVPDTSSLMWSLFGERCYDIQLPTHLFHFTPETLKKLLQQAGWSVTRCHWQRNSNTLLKSLEYLAAEKRLTTLGKATTWVRNAPRAAPLRQVMNLASGLTRQSGRMEIWARPIHSVKVD